MSVANRVERLVINRGLIMLKIPYDCPRGYSDCRALSNIVSDNKESFFCCGENNGDRRIKQDKYTVCFKGEHRDEISRNDKRDLIHNSAVIVQALAAIEKVHGEDRDWSPWEDL